MTHKTPASRFAPLLAATALGATLLATPATAGKIQRACLNADRSAATQNLCGCIEDVAGAMLSRSEQTRVVKFFKDPHKSQATRQSDRSSDESFWQKYKSFGNAVQTYCGS